MRDHGRVYCAFWNSADVQSMSDDARLLALYLLTSQHGTIAGVCRLPDGYVCEDIKWDPERVAKGFVELFEKGFANRCETTKWCWISKYLEWNRPENPNQWKAVHKVASQIAHNCCWLADFQKDLRKATGQTEPETSNGSETVPKPFRNQDQEKEQESKNVELHSTPKVNGNHGTPPGDVEAVFEHWRETWGKRKAKLDPKRKRVIQLALKSYPLAELCKAISGYRNSPHHCGQNERKTAYDDIELFLRDSKHIEAGLQFAEKHSGGVQWQ